MLETDHRKKPFTTCFNHNIERIIQTKRLNIDTEMHVIIYSKVKGVGILLGLLLLYGNYYEPLNSVMLTSIQHKS